MPLALRFSPASADRVVNRIVLHIIVDRANSIICSVKIAQAGKNDADHDPYVWHNKDNLIH